MHERVSRKNIIVISLLILTALIILAPVSQARSYENTVIGEDDHWRYLFVKGDALDDDRKYSITVNGSNARYFDVYILDAEQYDRYRSGMNFREEIGKENITAVEKMKFTSKIDGPSYYLVVDNMDNAHPGDAYANETISVNVFIEEIENEDLSMAFFFAFCGIVSIVIITIILWIVLEPRVFPQAKSSKFLNMTNRPAFQPMVTNPHVPLPPYNGQQDQFLSQASSASQFPPPPPQSSSPPPQSSPTSSLPPTPPPPGYHTMNGTNGEFRDE
jgi:hypothetical protein